MRRTFVLAAAACVAIVIGAYWNSLGNAFHFDDSHVVEDNLYIRSLRNVPRFFRDATTFSSIRSHASYRPLVSATLAVDYAIGGGLAPRQYHRTQIALLVALGAMLTAFYTRVLRDAGLEAAEWIALAGATLFCVHVANTETMNLISARSEELSVIGVVASLLIWLRWPRLRVTGLHFAPMAIGALAKIQSVMYAPILFAGVWLWQPEGTDAGTRTRRALRGTWPALAVAAGVYIFVRAMDAPEWVLGGTARLPYAWTQPFVWLHYARLFLIPAGLTADSDWALLPAWYDTRALMGDAFIGVLAFLVLRTWRHRATAPIAFGIVWFAIALVPASSVFPLAEVMNEHRVFFPYVGLVLAAACAIALGLSRLPATARTRRLAGAVLALAIITAHTAGTHARNRDWRTEETLWHDVTEKSPGNGRGLMNYGLTLMARGDFTGARTFFERAALITPNYSTLEINLGIVYGALKQPAAAETHFKRAIVLSPDAASHFYYARWLAGAGRGPEAVPHLEASLANSPAFLEARHLFMRLAAARGDDVALKRAANETLQIDPGDRDALAYARGASPYPGPAAQALSAGLAALGYERFDDAAEWFRAAALADPRSADALNNLGWAQFKLGFADAARVSYLRALAIDPAHERARNNLALLSNRPSG